MRQTLNNTIRVIVITGKRQAMRSLIAAPGWQTHWSPLRAAGAVGERPTLLITVFGFAYFQSAGRRF